VAGIYSFREGLLTALIFKDDFMVCNRVFNFVRKYKAIIKAVSYRFLGLTATAGITYVVTDSIVFAGEVATAEFFLKILGYWFHEKLWEKFF